MHAPTKSLMDSIEQKSAEDACKKVVQKLVHSVQDLGVTRMLKQVIGHLLNDVQKISRVHGDGAGPVANLTGRAGWYRKPDCTGPGGTGFRMHGTRRGRGVF
jgi:hypothetical protein